MKFSDHYIYFRNVRLVHAVNQEDCKKLFVSLNRLYDCGVLSLDEFVKLDNLVLDKIVTIDIQERDMRGEEL